ncbi:MAG: hypothetical protein A3F17_07020 [Gammaproteobacteria bacterium RIFCSPHIGHO2_12_FULL_41_15]|nr:MAG: hypothetical protein A3F17_07020 [Gammaproteobacteria bacterium RIFCSPHIGHO2_12_FULL_41_15]
MRPSLRGLTAQSRKAYKTSIKMDPAVKLRDDDDTVIASEAKQSRLKNLAILDCLARSIYP